MRWVAKAAMQKVLSALPRSEELNFVFQRRIMHTLPASQATFERKIVIAVWHRRAFLEHCDRDVSEAVFYEFGTGWDLAIPLLYHSLGIERQVLVDIRPNLRLELINDTLQKLRRNASAIEKEAGVTPRLVEGAASGYGELERRFGIQYLAPRDARETRLESASIDFVSSTDTLEHIPEREIAPILRECWRILRPSGLASFRIDMRNHYADFDPSVSAYHFLRFSDLSWRLANSSLHYQNRLRYPDYVRLFTGAGFELVEEEVSGPGPADLELLRGMKLAPRFRHYSLGDLGAKILRVVVRKKS